MARSTTTKAERNAALIQLDKDGIVGRALSDRIHQEPSEIHRARAAELVNIDPAELPLFLTVADLLVWVQTVKAAGGNMEAWRDIVDRFQPKPSRPTVAVITPGAGTSAPMASQNSEEQASAENYFDELQNAAQGE
jgi:hypothetical protein